MNTNESTPISTINSVGIKEEAKARGLDTITLLGTNGKTGDQRVTVYQLGGARVADTNGDPVWEQADPAVFAELLESEGINL